MRVERALQRGCRACDSAMSGSRESPRKATHTQDRGTERRFSEILANSTAHDAPPHKRPRRPRRTLKEEVADDLVFIRMTPHTNTETQAGPSHTRKLKGEPARLARRNSMSVKGMRRVSSLRDGAPAYPHDDIPDDVLYRHCSDQVPPVVRMKHLLSWTLHRSIPQALANAPLPKLGKRRHGQVRPGDDAELAMLAPIPPEALHQLTEQEKQHIAEVSPILQRVVQDTLRDLNDGLIGISWLRHEEKNNVRSLKPHPRNESNRQAEKQLQGMLEQLNSELASWKEHEAEIDVIHEEAEALEAKAVSLREHAASKRKGRGQIDDGAGVDEEQALADEVELARFQPSDTNAERAWTWADADDNARRQLTLVESVFASIEKLNHAVACRDPSEDTDLQGTEVDVRLNSLEWSVDKIYHRLHSIEQLDELSSAYIRRVSNRAAQALFERTTAGLATFSGSRSEAGVDEFATSAVTQQRLDALLAGIRDASDTSHGSVQHGSALPTDSHQLLRALARGPRT